MFQAIKRAKFLSTHNYRHFDTGDIVTMHLWLQKNGWPANEFVDLYMRGHRASPPGFEEHDALTFKLYMEDQYEWVQNKKVDSLNHLFETISKPAFSSADKDGLVNWLGQMVRPKSNLSATHSTSKDTADFSDVPWARDKFEANKYRFLRNSGYTLAHDAGKVMVTSPEGKCQAIYTSFQLDDLVEAVNKSQGKSSSCSY